MRNSICWLNPRETHSGVISPQNLKKKNKQTRNDILPKEKEAYFRTIFRNIFRIFKHFYPKTTAFEFIVTSTIFNNSCITVNVIESFVN